MNDDMREALQVLLLFGSIFIVAFCIVIGIAALIFREII